MGKTRVPESRGNVTWNTLVWLTFSDNRYQGEITGLKLDLILYTKLGGFSALERSGPVYDRFTQLSNGRTRDLFRPPETETRFRRITAPCSGSLGMWRAGKKNFKSVIFTDSSNFSQLDVFFVSSFFLISLLSFFSCFRWYLAFSICTTEEFAANSAKDCTMVDIEGSRPLFCARFNIFDEISWVVFVWLWARFASISSSSLEVSSSSTTFVVSLTMICLLRESSSVTSSMFSVLMMVLPDFPLCESESFRIPWTLFLKFVSSFSRIETDLVIFVTRDLLLRRRL